MEPTLSDKLLIRSEYLQIAEVAEHYVIASDTLHYYERIGLVPRVDQSDIGVRDYREIDVKRIEFIKCTRNAGLPTDMLVEYFGLVQQGDHSIKARKEILEAQRGQLVLKRNNAKFFGHPKS